MKDSDATQRSFDVDTRMVTAGAILALAGSVVAFAGIAIAAGAVATAARHVIDDMDVPPTQMMSEAMQRAKQASQAGMSAWRDSAVDHHAMT